MPRRVPLPVHLTGVAFATRESDFHGLSTARLRGRDLDRPFHGVRSVGLELTDIEHACRAYEAILLPGQAFSHVTALALYGAPLPATPARIHVSVEFPRTPPRGRGVHGHSVSGLNIRVQRGLPVVDPLVAWCQSAALLDREDLVAAGDHLVTGRRVRGSRGKPLVPFEALAAIADTWRHRPGAARVRWAAERVRAGVDSRRETLLRRMIVVAGLPEPEVDHPITVAGGLVLHADLAYPELRVAIEYEGDQHRDRLRWARDIRRREAMEDAGWRVVRVTSDDLKDPASLAARIRRAIASRR